MTWRRWHRPDGTKRKTELSGRSVAKSRAVLHTVFSHAEKLEIVPKNPVSETDVPRGDKREPIILDPEQYEALLEACVDPLVLGEAGLRCDSEALWLRWQDIDFKSGFITVETVRKGRRTKSGKARRVPMTPRLREALQAHAEARRMLVYGNPHKRAQWVFCHPRTRRRAVAGERITRLGRSFDNAAEEAELPPDLRQHDLRHRRCTTWLAAGQPVHLVRRAMGHADIKTTLGYYRFVDEHLLQLMGEQEALGRAG